MSARRLALTCDASGRIQEVIRDDYGITGAHTLGSPLVSLVPKPKISECFKLLDAIRNELAIYGWMFDIETPTTVENVYIAGLYDNGQYFLVTSEDLETIDQFNEEMMQINNNYINILRELIKSQNIINQNKNESDIYSELSSLSNEVTSLQRQLAKVNRDLEQALEEKNILLSMVSHDLKNPIESINICCSFLRKGETYINQGESIVDHIKESSDYMFTVISSTLNLISIESGNIKLYKEKIDLNNLVSRVINLNKIVSERKKIRILFDSNDSLEIDVDQAKMFQVVNNLVSNSIKYTPSGKNITIRVGMRDHMASIEVSDEGIGIDRTDIDKIFGEFVRLYEESPSEQHSWGLGLAIVNRIVNSHGGQIEVESEVGKGTMFRVLIPFL